jgi:hypothetical protein
MGLPDIVGLNISRVLLLFLNSTCARMTSRKSFLKIKGDSMTEKPFSFVINLDITLSVTMVMTNDFS